MIRRNILFVALGLAIFPAAICAESEKPLTLLPSTLSPFDFSKLERDYKAANHHIPRQVTTADLVSVTDQKRAAKIIEVGELVYRYYIWANRPPRYVAPLKYAALFAEAKPSLCDGATSMVRALLANDGIQSDSFNFLVPQSLPSDPLVSGQNFKLRGHTVARIKLERGAAIIDPTYGFVLITRQNDFSETVFADKDYEIFSIFDKPADPTGMLSPYSGLQLYSQTSAKPSFVGPSSIPIIARMPTISIPSDREVVIGSIDRSNEDLTNAFGGYSNHIGFWYQPTEHVWRFAPESNGTLRITFYLLGGDNPVLSPPLDLDIKTPGAKVISTERADQDRSITLILNVNETFSIEFYSRSVSARLIDALTIEHAKSDIN